VARTFLVALDGSPYGKAAVAHALRWARRCGAELLGVAVVDEPGILAGEPVGAFGDAFKRQRDEAVLARARANAEALLADFRTDCLAAGMPHQTRLEVGEPADRLLALAESTELTLLGRHTFFHFETQAHEDDTVEHVLRRTRRPVVVVPAAPPAEGAVVVAYHAEPAAVRALRSFLASGLAVGQEMHIVTVDADPSAASRIAGEAVEFCRSHGATVMPRTFDRSRPPAERVLQVVAETRAGTVVMGIAHHSWLFGWLGESTTESVLDDCQSVLFLQG
jgi:nucleotide-binding universal stress UspA family protein